MRSFFLSPLSHSFYTIIIQSSFEISPAFPSLLWRVWATGFVAIIAMVFGQGNTCTDVYNSHLQLTNPLLALLTRHSTPISSLTVGGGRAVSGWFLPSAVHPQFIGRYGELIASPPTRSADYMPNWQSSQSFWVNHPKIIEEVIQLWRVYQVSNRPDKLTFNSTLLHFRTRRNQCMFLEAIMPICLGDEDWSTS